MASDESASPGSSVNVHLPARGPGPEGRDVPGVALVTIDRPAALNALSAALIEELMGALEALDLDDACRCIVLTGAGERAFAAGGDVREMADATPETRTHRAMFERWDGVRRIRTPLVAAVRGYALGGGCELAMACDLIIAADDATFGQPELRLGIIPGAGGTQRLPRLVGRMRAMDLILTGRTVGAREAEAMGLVSRVVPAEALLDAALAVAATIAAQPPLAVAAALEAVDAASELPLTAGLAIERALFLGLFATEDQKEGMHAFLEKRAPRWSGR